ncbi:hypothetical protein CIW83_10945 [Tissierella sp. P1]|uniref:purine-cytosine permease family protein n=1 Tax=Tissierella sp. P1 TaxID=1280483 RepID=UPI000BA0D026|nr:cytosine permease [Tissierella sp. P1]OZV12134.1 hypothetical protein CIW83_10945 [Tissierella sp. P1]
MDDKLRYNEEKEDQFYDYPDRPVPSNKRRSQINIAVVTTGMAVAMSTLYTGASLAQTLSYRDAVLSIVIGCIILGIIAAFTGGIGASKGVSFSMLARKPFGREGSKIVGLVFAISMLGWFSYQCGYFGETIHLLVPNAKWADPKIAALWGGILMMSTAIIGFKGMTALSMIASPLLLGMCLYSGIHAINQYGYSAIVQSSVDNPASLGIGITIVVGGWITGAILQPDISRYAKSPKHNGIGIVIAMIIFAVANWGGLVIAKATMASTIMDGLIILGLGTIALMIVILGQWTSNDNNLYSAALGIINIKPGINKHKITAVCGIIFTLVATFGIQNYFIYFLELLGTFLPPFGGVLIADYYILKEQEKYKFDGEHEYEKIKPIAFISVIVGGLFSYIFKFGSTAINSILISMVVYIILSTMIKKSDINN